MQRVDKKPKDNLIKLRYQSPKDDATSSSQTIYSVKQSQRQETLDWFNCIKS